MKILYSALLAAGIASAFQSAQAQDLLEAYRLAAEGDPQLKAAEDTMNASFEARPQAKALKLPTISASAGLDQNFGVIGGQDSSFRDYNYGISLVHPLYDRAAVVQLRQADVTVNQAEVDFLEAQQNLLIRVAQPYFDVLSSADDLTFSIAQKEAIDRQLEQAKRRFEVGLVTITDVLEAQARYDLAVATEISAQNTLEDNRDSLREITGRYFDVLMELKADMPLDKPVPEDPAAWVDQAMQNNPSVSSSRYDVDLAMENIRLQETGDAPTVDLVGSYAGNDTGFSDNRGASIGVQLNVPLYTGGAVASRARQATFQHSAALNNLESVQRSVSRQVRDAYRSLSTSISQVQALEKAVASNQSALEATQAGFEVGTRTIVDVLDAQSDLFGAERDYSQARYNYVLALLNLKLASGQITRSDLETVNQWLVRGQDKTESVMESQLEQ